ncbi:hypothetical protein GW17_00017676 [Ensete ventricosum]|nr:hypothetical protein GW17_00017676 [Ensete ventricosum]
MSWRRRLGGEETLFFTGCKDAGLTVRDLGSRLTESFSVADRVSSTFSVVRYRYCCPLPLFQCYLLLLSAASTATAAAIRSTIADVLD